MREMKNDTEPKTGTPTSIKTPEDDGELKARQFIMEERGIRDKQWAPQQGEMVEVDLFEDSPIQREFIAMTSDGRYLCWSEDKTDAVSWKHCRPIKKPLTFGEWAQNQPCDTEAKFCDRWNTNIKSYAQTEDGKKWLSEIMNQKET